MLSFALNEYLCTFMGISGDGLLRSYSQICISQLNLPSLLNQFKSLHWSDSGLGAGPFSCR